MTLWYLARAAGFIAFAAATITVVLGALASRGRAETDRARDLRAVRQLAHRSSAVAMLGMLALHIVLLVTDAFVNVSISGALVPFTAGYRGFALGLGTLAVYGFAVVAISGALRGRLATSAAGARRWRAVHASAYIVWVLCLGHGLLSGTDTGTWWSTALYVGSLIAVAGALTWRLVPQRSTPDIPSILAESRRHLASGGTR